jgi:hypothetical protein
MSKILLKLNLFDNNNKDKDFPRYEINGETIS